jgi:hypothetical protein
MWWECALLSSQKVRTNENRTNEEIQQHKKKWMVCTLVMFTHAHASLSIWLVDEQCCQKFFSFSFFLSFQCLFLETYTFVHFNLLPFVQTRDVWKRSFTNVNHFVFYNMTAVCGLNYFDQIYIHIFLIGQKAKMSFLVKDIICFRWQVYLPAGHISVFLI